jgi:hypothetical protein
MTSIQKGSKPEWHHATRNASHILSDVPLIWTQVTDQGVPRGIPATRISLKVHPTIKILPLK